HRGILSMAVASWPMERTWLICFGAPRPTWTRFSRGPSQATCPSSNRPSSSWSSTSRPPRPSASRSRRRCWRERIRSSSKHARRLLEDAEPLRVDAQRGVELAAEVLQRDGGGELHHLRLAQVGVELGEER